MKNRIESNPDRVRWKVDNTDWRTRNERYEMIIEESLKEYDIKVISSEQVTAL